MKSNFIKKIELIDNLAEHDLKHIREALVEIREVVATTKFYIYGVHTISLLLDGLEKSVDNYKGE
jgi:hypothetical protein